MTSKFQSRPRKMAAAAVLAASGIGIGYMWGGGALVGADGRPALKPPVEAVENANSLSQAFRHAADQAMPAVVTIQRVSEPKAVATQQERRAPRGQRELPEQFRDLDPLLRRFFEELPEMESPRGGHPGMPGRPSASTGSGVIIDRSGLILTNNHVVAGGGEVKVKLTDGREFVATEVKTDPSTDLAIVRIKAEDDLPVAELGDSDDIRVGDWVLALGQPFGLANTVTAGIISAKGRGIGITEHEEYLQTDAAINPGNSGGPLVNLDGEVVGINTAISTTSGGYQGVGFAVPVNVAKWVSEQLSTSGEVHRAYLGVGIQPVTQDLAAQLGMSTPRGALVTEVRNDTPAEKAGVKVGDVITDYAGTPIRDPRQLSAVVARTELGSKQPLKLMRDGKEVTLHVTLQEMPANFKVAQQSSGPSQQEVEGTSVKSLGLEVVKLTADRAEELGLKAKEGVLIVSVDDDGAAARAGLETGMVIERVGQTPVRTPEELQGALKDASLERGVLLLVRTEGGSRFMVVKE
jgi:serine protease Do